MPKPNTFRCLSSIKEDEEEKFVPSSTVDAQCDPRGEIRIFIVSKKGVAHIRYGGDQNAKLTHPVERMAVDHDPSRSVMVVAVVGGSEISLMQWSEDEDGEISDPVMQTRRMLDFMDQEPVTKALPVISIRDRLLYLPGPEHVYISISFAEFGLPREQGESKEEAEQTEREIQILENLFQRGVINAEDVKTRLEERGQIHYYRRITEC